MAVDQDGVQPAAQPEPVSEPAAGTRAKPRDDARSIVDALEAKLDKQYPDRSGSEEERETEPAADVGPGPVDTPGTEPPD